MFNTSMLNQQETGYFNRAVGHAYKSMRAWRGGTKNRETAQENSDINAVLILLHRRGVAASFAEIYAHVNGRAQTLRSGQRSYTYNGYAYPSPPITYYGSSFDYTLPLIAFETTELLLIEEQQAMFSPETIIVEPSNQIVDTTGWNFDQPFAADGFGDGGVVNETVVNNFGDSGGFDNPVTQDSPADFSGGGSGGGGFDTGQSGDGDSGISDAPEQDQSGGGWDAGGGSSFDSGGGSGGDDSSF